MDSKTKKLALIGAAVVASAPGVTLALQAFNENLVFFFSPTQVAAQEAPTAAPSAWAAWSSPAASSARPTA